MTAIDCFLKQGSSHRICEDYIISGDMPIPYVILSDGCSSSKNTDVGARVLTYMAKQYLKYQIKDITNIDHNKMGHWIIHNAENLIRTMGLNNSCLDATLIISYLVDEYVYIFMYGDGFILTIRQDDSTGFSQIEYKNNAPYYLSYLIDSYRDSLYKKVCHDKSYNNSLGFSMWQPYDSVYIQKFKIKDFRGIFIGSDGIDSFINKDGSRYETKLVINKLLSFKNINGEFIKRRMGSKKGVINLLKEKDIIHYDDISVGGFFFDKVPK